MGIQDDHDQRSEFVSVINDCSNYLPVSVQTDNYPGNNWFDINFDHEDLDHSVFRMRGAHRFSQNSDFFQNDRY